MTKYKETILFYGAVPFSEKVAIALMLINIICLLGAFVALFYEKLRLTIFLLILFIIGYVGGVTAKTKYTNLDNGKSVILTMKEVDSLEEMSRQEEAILKLKLLED